MKRIVATSTLGEDWETYKDSKHLKTWFETAMNSNWETPNAVKQTYQKYTLILTH